MSSAGPCGFSGRVLPSRAKQSRIYAETNAAPNDPLRGGRSVKNKKTCIFAVIAALLAVAAVVYLVLTYRDEISDFLSTAKEKCLEKKNKFFCCSSCCDDYDE